MRVREGLLPEAGPEGWGPGGGASGVVELAETGPGRARAGTGAVAPSDGGASGTTEGSPSEPLTASGAAGAGADVLASLSGDAAEGEAGADGAAEVPGAAPAPERAGAGAGTGKAMPCPFSRA